MLVHAGPMNGTVWSLVCLGALAACGDDVTAGIAPEDQERELLRVAEGDRTVRIVATGRRFHEGPVGPGGKLPKLSVPGMRRSLEVVLRGSIEGASGSDELAVLTSETMWERDATEATLANMDVTGIRVDHCRDEGSTPRLAFRLRGASGDSLPGAPSGWVGVFVLANTIAPVAHVVEANDCAGALAALPPTAEAWLTAELDGSAPVRSITRRSIVRRGEAVRVYEGAPESPTASAAAIVALLEGVALDAVLRWALLRDEPQQGGLDGIPALVEDPSRAGVFLSALERGVDGRPVAATVPDVLALADGVPSEIAAPRAEAIAASVVAACSSAPAPDCTVGRLAAAGRLARRVDAREACTRLADLVVRMGEHEDSDDRAVHRLVLFSEVGGCAEASARRRAVVDLITAHDDRIRHRPPAACSTSEVETRLSLCGVGPLVAATVAMRACDRETNAALAEAAPRITSVDQRRALHCVLHACDGPAAAARAVARVPPIEGAGPLPSGECWPTSTAPRAP